MLCVLIKMLSHACAKKKAKRDIKVFRFRSLLVRFQATSVMAVTGLKEPAVTKRVYVQQVSLFLDSDVQSTA